jgi:hypothetical protein
VLGKLWRSFLAEWREVAGPFFGALIILFLVVALVGWPAIFDAVRGMAAKGDRPLLVILLCIAIAAFLIFSVMKGAKWQFKTAGYTVAANLYILWMIHQITYYHPQDARLRGYFYLGIGNILFAIVILFERNWIAAAISTVFASLLIPLAMSP